MNDFKLRTVTANDHDRIIELNQTVVKMTSEMDLEHLNHLAAMSCYFKVIIHHDLVVGFLLVMPPGKAYDSLNYRYFNDRYSSFYYVDRIVVDRDFAGQKLGSLLYQDLFVTAKKQGIENIACEFNIKPLNETSQKFHRKFGFTEVSRQWLDNNSKQVSLQLARCHS